jgi:hypothetical protein
VVYLALGDGSPPEYDNPQRPLGIISIVVLTGEGWRNLFFSPTQSILIARYWLEGLVEEVLLDTSGKWLMCEV